MLFNIIPLALLASTVIADGASILAAVSQISGNTTALENSVSSWDGSLIGALPIIDAQDSLLDAINDGTTVANASAPLSTTEALNLVTPVTNLVNDVKSALSAVEAAKPKFTALYLGGILSYFLGEDKTAADQFSAAVIAKVPAALQSVAQSLVAPIDPAFEKALSTYSS